MVDIAGWVAGTRRDVERRSASGEAGYAVVLRRHYDVPIDRLWEACTQPARLEEWFLPISGDLRAGGTYQFEGNAGGEILECQAPHAVRVAWVYADHPAQEVSLRLQEEAGGASLELRHIDPRDETQVIDLALAVGPGWDPPLIALGTYLEGNMPEKSWWMESPEAFKLIEGSVRAWQGALTERELASADAIAKAADASIAFYTGVEAPTAD